MSFFERLSTETRQEQQELLEIPFVRAAMAGELDLPTYVDFLGQAYHHVKHTVPLLKATRRALPERLAWLREELDHYIEEEEGHEEWILDDIAACGADKEAARRSAPRLPCELMVAYAWDTIQRVDPIGFFGMVHVLEGTSVRGATQAAEALRAHLGLPRSAFTYLTSHGSLDIEHVDFFQSLMNRVEEPADQDAILHAAHVFFRLYGDIFRGIDARRTVGASMENAR